MTRIKLNNKELKQLGIKDNLKKQSTPFDRLQKAIEVIQSNNENDYIKIDTKEKHCIIYLENIRLLSNNDILRNDNRKVLKYKNLWHKRIENLTSSINLAEWEPFKNKPLILECLYKSRTANFMDPDAIVASFKAPLDGLVEAKIINDDKTKDIPLIIPRQEKNNNKRNDLLMILTPIEDEQVYYTKTFKKYIKTIR